MPRYRHKDDTDLVWNRIRRAITRELDTEIQNRREAALNELLTQAWTEYSRGLKDGTVREVESRYKNLVSSIVADVVQAPELDRAE